VCWRARACVPEFTKSNSNGFIVRDCAAAAVVIGRTTVVDFAIVRTKSNETVGAQPVSADVLYSGLDAIDGGAPAERPDSELLVQLPTWCGRSTRTHRHTRTHAHPMHTRTHTH
jgi:hypothetical protein